MSTRSTQVASPPVQQHTFQRNEKSFNWGFDDLTYISTGEMYVNRCRLAHPVPSSRTKRGHTFLHDIVPFALSLFTTGGGHV